MESMSNSQHCQSPAGQRPASKQDRTLYCSCVVAEFPHEISPTLAGSAVSRQETSGLVDSRRWPRRAPIPINTGWCELPRHQLVSNSQTCPSGFLSNLACLVVYGNNKFVLNIYWNDPCRTDASLDYLFKYCLHGDEYMCCPNIHKQKLRKILPAPPPPSKKSKCTVGLMYFLRTISTYRVALAFLFYARFVI